LFNRATTTSTTLRNPSISSSTVPPIPALAKLVELPTYTGLPNFRARIFAKRVVKSKVLLCVKRGVLSVSAGEARYEKPMVSSISRDSKRRCELTFGIAYTKLPSGAAEDASDDVVVRKRRTLGPFLWSWRWMFDCGARGRGNATAMGLLEVSPLGTPFAVDAIAGVRRAALKDRYTAQDR
jgi:hypothetical protein